MAVAELTLVYDITKQITILHGGYKPTYNWGAHPVTHERKKNMKTTEVLVSRLRRNYNHFTHKCAGALLSSMDRFPSKHINFPYLSLPPLQNTPGRNYGGYKG